VPHETISQQADESPPDLDAFTTKENAMPRGFLSARIDDGNLLHHIWCNNGTWWVHYTLHWANRKRRIRRSLKTSDVRVAIARRDALFARIEREGEEVPERGTRNAGESPPAAVAA
jgi:hypothetical protein